MRPEEIDDILRNEKAIAWRPELTIAVMAGIRQDRLRTRWSFAAAAALILMAAGIGALALTTRLETTGFGPEIATRIPAADSVRTTIGAGWAWLASRLEAAIAPVDPIPRSPGIALAIAALTLLVLVNGATIGRPALARRRNS